MFKKRNHLTTYLITGLITVSLFFIPFSLQAILDWDDFKTLIYSLFSQGFPYHDTFKELLLNQQLTSLLTQGQMALGKNFESMLIQYFGNFTYLCSLGVKQSQLPYFFFISTGLKTGLAAISFMYLLKAFESRKIPLQIVFSVLYGLSGYGLLYLIHPLWIDTLVLLPLLILGVHRYVYLQTKKLFITTFFLAVLNNPTHLSMLWITCSLYFLLQTSLIQSSKLKTETWNYLKLFAWTLGFSAFLLIPLVLTNPSFLMGTNHSTEWVSFNWLSPLLFGANETELFPCLTQSFTSLGMLIGCGVFFIQPHRSKIEKNHYAFFFIALIGLSSFQPLSTIHLTTHYLVAFNPYLLVLVFFAIWFSYRAFYHLNESDTQQYAKKVSGFFALGLTIILLAVNIELSVFTFGNTLVGIAVNILLVLVYYFTFKFQYRVTHLLVFLLWMEISSSQLIQLQQSAYWFETNDIYYQVPYESETSVVVTSLESWFRQENHLTHFTPSPATSLLTSSNDSTLRYPFSAYFTSNPISSNFPRTHHYFETQNRYIKALFGLDNHPNHQIFLPINSDIYSSQNIDILSENKQIHLLDREKEGKLHLRLYPDENRELYLYLKNYQGIIGVEIDGQSYRPQDLIHYTIPQTHEVVNLIFTFQLKQSNSIISFPEIKVLHSTLFETLATDFQSSPFQSLKFELNRIEGELSCTEQPYLLINIPYHPNWKAFVDHKEVVLQSSINDCILVPIEKGTQLFELIYYPKYLEIGVGISVITLILHFVRKIKVFQQNKRKELTCHETKSH